MTYAWRELLSGCRRTPARKPACSGTSLISGSSVMLHILETIESHFLGVRIEAFLLDTRIELRVLSKNSCVGSAESLIMA